MLPIASLFTFIVAIILFTLAIYHSFNALTRIKKERRITAGLLGPFAILIPSNFSEKGNYHRIRMGRYWLLSLFFLALSSALKELS